MHIGSGIARVSKSRQSLADRSWLLVFPANNLNTTLYVNGQLCGFDKNPLARLQFDITAAVKPGVNELWVGIRDGWYGYQADPQDPMKLRRRWNLPLKFFSEGFQELVYPIWNQTQMGIVGTPELIAAGPRVRGGRLLQTVGRSQATGGRDCAPEQPVVRGTG